MTSRRRFAAGLAALAGITAALVLSGVTAAQADDGLEITTTTVVADGPMTISGSASGANLGPIELRLGLDADGPLVCTATYAAGWSCDATGLPVGNQVLTARQAEDISNGYTARLDTATVAVTLPTPTVTAPSSVPTFGTIQLQGGNGYEFATIVATVTTPNEPGLTCSTGALEGSGDWGCNIPFGEELAPGSTATITVTQSHPDAASTFTTHDVLIEEEPVLAITSPADGASIPWTSGETFVISGTSPDLFNPISIYLDGEEEVCQIPEPMETWSCSPISLGPGSYFLVAQQYLQEDAGVEFTVTVTSPALECAFRPNGGFSASSPQTLEYLDIYEISGYTGGGFSSGSGSPEDPDFGEQGYCNGDAGVPVDQDATADFSLVSACDSACDLPSLPPGDYEVYHQVANPPSQPGYSTARHSYIFRVPSAPSIATAVSTTNSVVLRGSATAGDTLNVVRSNGNTLCSTTVTATGTWACQFPKSSASSARVIDIDAQSGGMSAYSASRAIPVFVPPVTPEAPVEPPVVLVNWFLEFGGDLMDLKPGDTFTLNVSGMPEGTEIEVWMHSTPVLIGTATGTGLPMKLNLTVPQNIESGPHEIEMIGVTPLGTQYFFTSDAVVTGGIEPAEPLKDEPVLDEKPDAVGSGDRADPAAPSGISEGIAPASAIIANPASIAIAGGLALALLFLVALPTELLNSSLSSNTSRLGRAYGTVDGALTKAQDWFIKVTRSRAIAAVILTTIVAIIYGFVDPGFGFDIVSLRLVLSLAIAFFLLSFVASWISGMIIRRAWGAMGVIAMQPSIILFAIVGVIVARVLDFSPGFLVGIAIGLELLQASRTVSARAVFVQIAVVTGLALAAWGIYSVFTPGDDFVGMLVEDTMVAVTAEGLTGALIALFPLKFLDGHDLWAVSKRLWVLAFLVVATAFALLVLPTAIQGTDVADYGVWLLVFGVFGLGSLAVWLIFVRADKKAAEAEKESVDA